MESADGLWMVEIRRLIFFRQRCGTVVQRFAHAGTRFGQGAISSHTPVPDSGGERSTRVYS